MGAPGLRTSGSVAWVQWRVWARACTTLAVMACGVGPGGWDQAGCGQSPKFSAECRPPGGGGRSGHLRTLDRWTAVPCTACSARLF